MSTAASFEDGCGSLRTVNLVEIEFTDVPVRYREIFYTHISVVAGTYLQRRSIHVRVLSEKVATTSSGTPNTGVVVIVVQGQECALTPISDRGRTVP
jgi:hypothetical protein